MKNHKKLKLLIILTIFISLTISTGLNNITAEKIADGTDQKNLIFSQSFSEPTIQENNQLT